MSEKLDKLSERFPVEDVKQRRQGGTMLDYISIDATIGRLNAVLGLGWSFEIDSTQLMPLEGGKYLALVQGKIAVHGTEAEPGKIASGVGSDIAADPDKAIKTALAESLKKAGHQLGIGLYLWDESEREVIARERKAGPDKVQQEIAADTDRKFAGKAGSNDFGSGSF